MEITFYIAATITIIATFLVIISFNPVHALLYLIVSLLGVAVIFYLLGAPFVAALEAIVYAGAIVVLFVFVVMMLNLGSTETEQERQWLRPRMFIGPSILSGVLLLEMIYVLVSGTDRLMVSAVVSPRDVGIALYGPYLLVVELGSMLLLAGLIGAYHLGRRDPLQVREER